MQIDPILALATMPAILAIVQFLKTLFPNMGKWALLVAVVLGVLVNVLDFLFSADPLYQAAVTGLMLGLGAAGFYDGARLAGFNVKNLKSATVIPSGDVNLTVDTSESKPVPPKIE